MMAKTLLTLPARPGTEFTVSAAGVGTGTPYFEVRRLTTMSSTIVTWRNTYEAAEAAALAAVERDLATWDAKQAEVAS